MRGRLELARLDSKRSAPHAGDVTNIHLLAVVGNHSRVVRVVLIYASPCRRVRGPQRLPQLAQLLLNAAFSAMERREPRSRGTA